MKLNFFNKKTTDADFEEKLVPYWKKTKEERKAFRNEYEETRTHSKFFWNFWAWLTLIPILLIFATIISLVYLIAFASSGSSITILLITLIIFILADIGYFAISKICKKGLWIHLLQESDVKEISDLNKQKALSEITLDDLREKSGNKILDDDEEF